LAVGPPRPALVTHVDTIPGHRSGDERQEPQMAADDPLRDFFAASQSRQRQRKLAVIVAAELAEDIFERGLRPGDALPNEAEMLQALGVSRGTLRETLRVLETQGLISINTGRGGGPVVAQPSARAVAETLMVNFRALRVSFGEILHTRDAIEPALARQAALNWRDDDLRHMREAAQRMADAHWSDVNLLQFNRDFHSSVAVASRNRPLAILWSAIASVADGQGLGTQYDERLWAAGNAAHFKIVSAIEARDPDAAERAMARHVDEYHDEMAGAYPDLMAAPVKAHRDATA